MTTRTTNSTNNRNFDNSRDDANDNFRQEDGNSNRRSRKEPPQGYDDSPPREYLQSDDRRQQDTSNRGSRNTDGRQNNDNQHEEERANEGRTTPRTTVRGTDNSKLLESRDKRIPDNVETLIRTSDASRKRASPPKRVSRHASDKLPHQGHRNTQRTHVRSPVTQIIILIQEIPRDTRVPNPLPLDPPEIVVLPATDRIIDYELQTAAFRAQAAGGGPDPNAARAVRPPIPQYIHDRTSLQTVPPHPLRPLQHCSGWSCCG